MTDSSDDVVAVTLAIYRQLCADYERAQENVENLQSRQRDLQSRINDCFAASRLFGFDLRAEFEREAKGDPRQSTLRAPNPIVLELAPVPASPLGREGPTIKTLVLEAAEKAHPNPIKAADIRHQLAASGHIIHEKTVGMTLYRWSEKGCTRREGRDWYFVPTSNVQNGKHFGPEPVRDSIPPDGRISFGP